MTLEIPHHIRPLRERVETFLTERVYPAEDVLNREDHTSWAQLRTLMEEAKSEGLWALGHPEEIGGQGLDFLDYVFVNEVIGRSEHGVFVFGTHSLQDSIMLQLYASPRWREQFLRPLVNGEIFSSIGMTEPDVASSDPTQYRTTAVLEDGHWVINGRKWFTSGAGRATYTTVMARTEPDAPNHDAFSMIVVPNETAGYDIVRDVPMLGMHGHEHCEVVLDDVRVPEDHLLGPRGQGFKIAQQRLGPGRIFHVMRFLGQAQRAFDLMCERANNRTAFGSTLAEKQLVQKMVFDSYTEIQASRLMTLKAAERIDQGDEARVEIGAIKVVAAQMLNNVVDRAVQIFGAKGLTNDTPLGRMYRHARPSRIYDGPDEVHIQSVARRLLRRYADGGDGLDFALD